MDVVLLWAIALMVYQIGLGLALAATLALDKNAGQETPPSAILVLLIWPVVLPLILVKTAEVLARR